MSVVACEECESASAAWRCMECSQSLCSSCDANLHAKGARKAHKRTPFAQPSMRAVVPDIATVRMQMPTKPATVAQASKLPESKAGDRTSAYLFEDPEREQMALLGQIDNITLDLKSDMSQVGRGQKEISKSCARCNLVIAVDGNFVSAMGQRFHQDCFKCAHCGKMFGSDSAFVEQDGKPYCPADHKMLFSSKCFACGGYIKERLVRAMGRSYHAEHFVCTKCNKPLSDNFTEQDGKPYCKEDYAELFGSRCPVCNKGIAGSFIDTNGKRLHAECFVCTACHRSLLKEKAFNYNGQPYCEAHFHQQNNSVCKRCALPVVGKAVQVNGRTFHPDCFTCTVCNVRLTTNYFELNGKNYCEAHQSGK